MDATNFCQALKTSPKSFVLLKGFVIHALSVMQQMMAPQDLEGVTFPDLNEFVTEDAVNQVIQSNPRTLYEFFDNQGIYVNVRNLGPNWYAEVNTIPYGASAFSSRPEAEMAGFIEALKTLENKTN